MKIGLFAGTFDPPTNGHQDVIFRAAQLCEQLIVAVSFKPQKKQQSLFTMEERVELLKKITAGRSNIIIAHFQGLVVDYAKQQKVSFFVRGIRSFSDFEAESQMAFANRRLSGIDTIFLMADNKQSPISSSLIREIAYFGGSLGDFVPKEIERDIQRRASEKK